MNLLKNVYKLKSFVCVNSSNNEKFTQENIQFETLGGITFPATAKFNIRAAATQISPLGLGSFWGNCV